ncbi:hypothetical protein RhiJN_07058 [Ceratobasidium sp. AG-Ba]|nr:hypothetical protein RhiJN_07058 [Ceratobasidium sp. AG-Ba]
MVFDVWAREPLDDTETFPCQFVTDEATRSHNPPATLAEEWVDVRLGAVGPTFIHDGMVIRRRNVAFDEALGNDQSVNPVLKVHVYDVLHTCDRFPGGRAPVELQWVYIRLARIQRQLLAWTPRSRAKQQQLPPIMSDTREGACDSRKLSL